MKKPEGGAAFPRPLSKISSEEIDCGAEGMTLRDYFAAQAMNAMSGGPVWPAPSDSSEIARRSFAIADAMIAEREK